MEYNLNTVVMPILMSLSGHFNVSDSSGLTGLFIMDHVFLPLPIFVILYWTRILNFTFRVLDILVFL